jgi:putative intracellular protease/amidase
MSKVLAVVTSHDSFDNVDKRTGLWLGELTHFHDQLVAAGHEVDVVSVNGGAVPIDQDSLGLRAGPQGANKAFQADPATRAKLDDSRRPDEVDPDAYAALYFAGGHGAMWDFPDDGPLLALAGAIHDHGGLISSVCHGAAGLINLRGADGELVIAERRVTGFTNREEKAVRHTGHVPFSLEDELSRRAREFAQSRVPFVPHVVVDERVVTGQNPLSAKGVGRAVAELLA